jgi:APA family basic amino acid/polyamine antiporter
VFPVVLVAIAVVGIVLTRDSHAAWSLSAVTVLVYYSLTNLAALKLPPDQRLYPRWIAVVGLCGCLLLAAHVDSSSCLLGGSVLLVGLVARVVTRALKSSS